MCDLCSGTEEERNAARRKHVFYAEMMEALASDYRNFAKGEIMPHTDTASKVGDTARSLIRELVDEWV